MGTTIVYNYYYYCDGRDNPKSFYCPAELLLLIWQGGLSCCFVLLNDGGGGANMFYALLIEPKRGLIR